MKKLLVIALSTASIITSLNAGESKLQLVPAICSNPRALKTASLQILLSSFRPQDNMSLVAREHCYNSVTRQRSVSRREH